MAAPNVDNTVGGDDMAGTPMDDDEAAIASTAAFMLDWVLDSIATFLSPEPAAARPSMRSRRSSTACMRAVMSEDVDEEGEENEEVEEDVAGGVANEARDEVGRVSVLGGMADKRKTEERKEKAWRTLVKRKESDVRMTLARGGGRA